MKIKTKIGILTSLIMMASAIVFTACKNENEEPVAEHQVSYSTEMQPFFNARCTGCHGSRNPNLEAPDSYNNIINGSYVNTASPETSSLYIVLDGYMGTDVTDDEKAMTLKWIEQGAKDN